MENKLAKLIKILHWAGVGIVLISFAFCGFNLIEGITIFKVVNTKSINSMIETGNDIEKAINDIVTTEDYDDHVNETDPIVSDEPTVEPERMYTGDELHSTLGIDGAINGLRTTEECPCGGTVYLIYDNTGSIYYECENKDLNVPFLSSDENYEGSLILMNAIDGAVDVGGVIAEGVTVPYCPMCGAESCGELYPILITNEHSYTIVIPHCGCYVVN